MEQLALTALQLAPGSMTLPGSKSISNRCLLLAALAHDQTELFNVLKSDDTHYMLEALTQLGIQWTEINSTQLHIKGCHGHFPISKAELFLGNAGTAFRPLTAVLGLLGGDYQLSGVARMHERPIKDLVDALCLAGANIHYLQQSGYPPLQIGQFQDTHIKIIPVQGNVSSQFLTALLIALPLTKEAYQIQVMGELISKPYIDITLNLLQKFGVSIKNHHYQCFDIPANSQYCSPDKLYIEGDASAASYFLAAGFLSATPITVEGVGKNSIQGDIEFAYHLEQLGAQIEWMENSITASRDPNQIIPAFNIDANRIPDAAMTLAIIALAAQGTSTIRNIASWKVKETDRLQAMKTELEKLGTMVSIGADYIHITPPKQLKTNIAIDTYDDHRIAMCFSLVSLLNIPIIINEPQCVNKTYPGFFTELLSLQAQ